MTRYQVPQPEPSNTAHFHRRDASIHPFAEQMAQHEENRRQQQIDVLSHLDCLSGAPREHLARLVDLCVLRAFVAGTLIVSERTPSDHVYFVVRGTVSLMLHDRDGHKVLIGVLDRGDCFGEGPLFGDLFRGASVIAETDCYLLQVPRTKLSAVLDSAPELATALRNIYRRRLIENTLGHMPLFARLSPLERTWLASLLKPKHYNRGTRIIREGQVGQALHLIEEGQVVVEQAGQTIAYLDEGDFFGEMALLLRSEHNADVRALTPVSVLALPADDFMQLLHDQPEIKAHLHELVEQRLAENAAMHRDPARAEQLTEAIKRGLLRGTHVLVRNPLLCQEGCKICETACATRHGKTRIHIDGVMLNGLDVTDSCRQCRVGAECVEACPEDAIQWNQNGALVITDRCTGCGKCVPACPYDAVNMLPIQHAQPSPLWALWQNLTRRKETIPLQETQPAQRANKCDLCHGYDDLACVSACPTGAIRLMPVEELFTF